MLLTKWRSTACYVCVLLPDSWWNGNGASNGCSGCSVKDRVMSLCGRLVALCVSKISFDSVDEIQDFFNEWMLVLDQRENRRSQAYWHVS